MKKNILLTMLILFIAGSSAAAASQSTNEDQSPFEKALVSLMFEDIYKAVEENYEFDGVQSWQHKVVNLKMKNDIEFVITIQIETFIGAHNIIGTDYLTFKRDDDGLQLINYKHVPSKDKKEILEWYFNR
ncbi:DUF3888 domain-containing protein [Bacillus sp. PS06]|uniref:DUF3888 domain-containing protein n=1 Tax=Bacillus sp. PS06 TaxID=2764176 RepID=UPI001783B39E|nr:DUF3888 domain-containing protein [Bacillus sp. PS06]MBD8068773.1 DUF3888 domain-containing protein [Bacillus sp. PS06]